VPDIYILNNQSFNSSGMYTSSLFLTTNHKNIPVAFITNKPMIIDLNSMRTVSVIGKKSISLIIISVLLVCLSYVHYKYHKNCKKNDFWK